MEGKIIHPNTLEPMQQNEGKEGSVKHGKEKLGNRQKLLTIRR